ncbi:MAG: transglutaminase family protein [Deltaproteobacteria bacterium]|nr:transglutaminase family protein [Deltaproteobacteria bacterium]
MGVLADAVDASPLVFEDVALAIAADEYPGLRRERYHRLLDELAAPATESVAAATTPAARLTALCDHLYGQRGYCGNEDYDDPRNNYLNEVIERRRGSPVTMAVLLIAVARRAELPIEPVAFPGHFLVRTASAEPIYVDPFDGGHPLPREELEQLACETLDGDRQAAARRLEPVGARTVAVRILLNLQRCYRTRQDHGRLLVVCDRLFDMTGAPFHQCDRGIHALALGATQAAIHDLEAYLLAHPDAPDAAEVRAVLDKARRLDSVAPS